jgi:hypothetical protein
VLQLCEVVLAQVRAVCLGPTVPTHVFEVHNACFRGTCRRPPR